MVRVIQSVVLCVLIACVYGAPADTTGSQDIENFQHKVEKTFKLGGQTLTETLEQTDGGIIIDVEAQLGSSALTVFRDVTHGLLVHRYNADDYCYISSLAEYNDTESAHRNRFSVFKYRLEPVSEINYQYFRHTSTDSMKRVCRDAGNILWTEIHANDEQEMRQKRRSCKYTCGNFCWPDRDNWWCDIIRSCRNCSHTCRYICS